MTKKDMLADLRAAIGKQMKPHEPEPPAAARQASSPTKAPSTPGTHEERKPRVPRRENGPELKPVAALVRSGRGMQFYLDETDRRIMNSLAVWFASQDRRVSDSQVIKAAIRLASGQQNTRLLDICDEVRATDRRRGPKPKPERAGKS